MARVKQNPDESRLDLPAGVKLTANSLDDWHRLTTGLPLEEGAMLLFAIVDAPVVRERLATHLASTLSGSGFPVNTISVDPSFPNPVVPLFDAIESAPEARAHFVMGLEQILSALDRPEESLEAVSSRRGLKEVRRPLREVEAVTLTALSLGRDRIPKITSAPLLFWLDSAAFRALASGAVSFMQWRGGEFRLEEDEGPMAEAKARYRQHIIDRFSKLTLYSVTSEKPLAVDLERVFVRLMAIERVVSQQPGLLEDQSSEMARALTRFRAKNASRSHADTDLSAGESPELRKADPIPRWVGSLATRFSERSLTLNEAVGEHPSLAIIGAPGSGKTTLLKYLALSYARRQAKYRLGQDEDRLPLFVTLRDFNKYVVGLDRHVPGASALGSEHLAPYLTWFHSEYYPSLALPDGFFAAALADDQCVVLLDGLDEVAASQERERVARFVGSCAARHSGNRFVVTSRPRGYEIGRQYLSDSFDECTIQDFDEEQITGFVESWYLAVTVDREGDTPTARDKAAKSAEDLLGALKDDQIRPLAASPLLLSILALIHQRGNRLPQRRVALYEECIEFLLGFWRQVQGGEAARELANIGGSIPEKRALIQPLALKLHERGEQAAEVSRKELEELLTRQFGELYHYDAADSRTRAAEFVDIIVQHSGLLVERENGVFAFAHLTFQEFLAARELADNRDYIEFIPTHLHDPWWREVILLLAGYLSTPCTRRARAETAALLSVIRDAGSPLEDALHRDLLLAFTSLCDTAQLGVDHTVRNQLADDVVDLWRQTPSPALRNEIDGLFTYAAPTPAGDRVINRLIEVGKDSSEDVRGSAAYALGSMGAAAARPEVLERLVELSQDSSESVRVSAADALGSMGAAAARPGVLERLVELIQDSSPVVRGRAADALGSMGPAAAGRESLSRMVALVGRGPALRAANLAWSLGGARERLAPKEVTTLVRFWAGCLGTAESHIIGGEYQSLDSAAYRQLHDLAPLLQKKKIPRRRTKSAKS
ncbi:MAG TPA: HEAT repeat domain-containing protein [Blastocatellia bacterium]